MPGKGGEGRRETERKKGRRRKTEAKRMGGGGGGRGGKRRAWNIARLLETSCCHSKCVEKEGEIVISTNREVPKQANKTRQ